MHHRVFRRYRSWLRKVGLAYIDPSEVKKPLGRTTAWAAGLQRGVLSSKHAAAPVVGYGVEATTHSAMTTNAARMGVHPWSWWRAGERDLKFAAATTAERGERAGRCCAEIADTLQDSADRPGAVAKALPTVAADDDALCHGGAP